MQLDRDYTVDKDDTAAKCLAAAKHAIRLCPQSWLHWNILGVICMSPYIKNYALAQHCFVMAIDQESNNAIAWSNLATLYLHLGTLKNIIVTFSFYSINYHFILLLICILYQLLNISFVDIKERLVERIKHTLERNVRIPVI